MGQAELPNSIHVDLPENRAYSIFPSSLTEVPALMRRHRLRVGRCVIVTDQNVGLLYAEQLENDLRENGWTPNTVTLPPGEGSKSLPYLREIYDAALGWRIDRQTPVLALGGGVVGDIAGFAAATLLRGLPLVQIPTSLIAQVDSSIGGKTGINHDTGKNLVGAFYQPAFVCSDVSTLRTLPHSEWNSGLAEVVKHALIAEASFLDWLLKNVDEVLEKKDRILPELICRAAAIKAGIVAQDEREQGRRAILNFGHTFGHALEKVTGYGTLAHGEAVLIGMKAALRISSEKFPDSDFSSAVRLISRIPSPEFGLGLQLDSLWEAMQTDKKADAGNLRFILLKKIGEAFIDHKTSRTEIEDAWRFVLDGK